MKQKPKRQPIKRSNARLTGAHLLDVLTPVPGGIQAKARARVGAGDLARLAWLLNLLNYPPEGFAIMAEQERRELEAEVAVFCDAIGSITGGLLPQMSIDAARELARDIRERLLAMLDGAPFELEIPAVTLVSIPGSEVRYLGEPVAIFRLAVARLIEAEGQRIKVCARPGCSRFFVRRKRGLYCGKKCSQLEQFSRYLTRHAPNS